MGFVPDCICAYLLYTYGGVYIDTDLELLQNIDFLLENKAFCGIENNFDRGGWLGTGILGAEKGLPYFKALTEKYAGLHFINPDGSINRWCTSNHIFSTVMQDIYGKPLPKETTPERRN